MAQLPWKVALARVVPVCFVLGASMELFMIKTGFYEIVTRKEGERRAEMIQAGSPWIDAELKRKSDRAQ